MSQPQLLQIKLSRFDAQPWGFRLQGGVDFAAPLLVQKVNGGSLAEQAGLQPGDAVIKINDVDVFNLRHKDAQDIVVRSGNNFVITIQRGGSTWRPHVTPTGHLPQPQQNSPYLQTVTKTSLAHKQQEVQHIGSGYNNSARPFVNGGDGNVKSIVNKQYNTPVGIYSDESIAETLSAQAEVLAGGVLGVNFKKNEREYQADKSEVLKFLREEETGQSTPEPPSSANFYWTQSHAIGGNERRTPQPLHPGPKQQNDQRVGTPLQQNTLAPAAPHRPSLPQAPAPGAAAPKPAPATSTAPGATAAAAPAAEETDPRLIVAPICPALQGPEYKAELEAAAAAQTHDGGPRPLSASGHPACQLCGVGIVGVFVRIKDKNLHVECFKCATCGTSLKNQGYYNFNNKLYCDIHAKLAALQNPPPGTEGYVPVPIKPNTKLSANTISSALNAHGYNGGPIANGGSSTPTPAPVVSPSLASAPTATKVDNIVSNSLISNSNISVNSDNKNEKNMSLYSTLAATGEQPLYGHAAPSGGPDQPPFEYVTLTGNVIRSVVPPGKGANINYKVNQGYARPYGASGAQPPSAAPKSPVSYPPQPQQWGSPQQPQQQQWGAPQQQQQQWGGAPQPKAAAGSPYATLPRSNVGQQDPSECLQLQFAELCYEKSHAETTSSSYFEEDVELTEASRRTAHFSWPPPRDDSHDKPTAAPLYIAPPETQHVVAKPIEYVASSHTVQSNVSQQHEERNVEIESRTLVEVKQQQEQQLQQQQQIHWQSHSAPQLTSGLQAPELESSSDSYTSTSTTTTTTSEEYQRMYAAQVQAYQIQQAYEQYGSELDYHMDLEVAAAQQNQQEQSYLCSAECLSGRRSAQECAETLAVPLSTYKLIDMVREVTPSPVPQANAQGPKHVVFLEQPEVKVVPPTEPIAETRSESKQEAESVTKSHQTSEVSSKKQESQTQIETSAQEITEEKLVVEDRSHILESQRIFQPTPEINFEIAPVRQIPPTKIPNPVPKEWINPMIRALTTAPEEPFHLVECPCPISVEIKLEEEQRQVNQSEVQSKSEATTLTSTEERRTTEVEKKLPDVLRDSPPKGSRLTDAMSTAPEFAIRFAPPASKGIPLPEETEPYMPPPIDMKPYMREDYRPKSPFLSALTTAPEKPFEGHFDRDVPIHLLDLPTPKEHLTMSDALRTASERPYTPLNPENATNIFHEQEKEKERKKYQFQILDNEEALGVTSTQLESAESVEYYTTEKRRDSQRQPSAFAAMQAFQPSCEPLPPGTPRNSVVSLSKEEPDLEYEKYCKAKERNQKRLTYLHKKEEELQKETQQSQSYTNKCQSSSISSCTKESSSINSSSAVQQISTTTTYASKSAQASRSSCSASYGATTTATTATKVNAHEIIEETAEELEHSEVLFPPPSPLSHLKGGSKAVSSGLHKADTIPKYQRNWTVLPTQSPARTPEPQELRENIPLAFVDAPKTPSALDSSASNPVHKPVAQISTQKSTALSCHQQQTAAAAQVSVSSCSTSASSAQQRVSEQRQQQPQPTQTPSAQQPPKTTVPIIIEDRSGPVTMAFQSLDEHLQPDLSQTPSRTYTPSLTNKPAPIIPFYQTPEKLCFDECPATHAREYDRRSASPYPDRARSPAPGPPPNPLSAIRAPRLKETEVSQITPRVLQAGSITTGQSYLGAQQAQQQGQLLSHYESTSQKGAQSYTEKPEVFEERKVGDLTIQKREKESKLEEQKQSQLQSHTTTQIGNTQIERRRKVTEEFEHTQSAKTIEIRTGSQSTTEQRQSYGKTGFVANQARRLSGLEQEITNLTSQSQAISARAANLTDTSFPQLKSPEPESKFPTKPVFPPHDEPKSADYILSASANSKLVGPPPGFRVQQQQQQQQLSVASGASLVSSQQQQYQQLQQQQQQQQKSLSAFSSTTTTTSTSLQANAVSCSLTKASATNNQASLASSAYGSSAAVTCGGGANAVGGICSGTAGAIGQPPTTTCLNNNLSNNTYRPTASTGLSGFKPPQASAAPIAAKAAAPAKAPAPAPAPANLSAPLSVPNASDNSNVSGSSGAGPRGGTFGATSAPKRGRGIFNKAVAPGVRVPLCNSCGTQIRGPFITALGRIWCPEHFICVNANCRRPLQDIGFVEEKGDLYCEYCFEKYLAPTCSKCGGKIKGDCLNAIGRHFHPECFTCGHCGKVFGNTPFFLEDGNAYCEADWNELFTTKCFACGFPVEAGDRWVEALNHNYHSQCFNCTFCKQNLEGQSFYNKGGRPFCKNHAR